MNFLQLVQRLRMEAGVSGTGPVSVVAQTGEMAELVTWIQAAYQDIQNLRPNWRFMQDEFTFPMIAGVKAYLPSAVSLDDLAIWLPDDVRAYLVVADESALTYEPWADFRAIRDMGAIPTGRPTHFSIKPNNALVFWPTPDDDYTCRGEYICVPDELSGNTDTPIIPAQYHMLIVWRALTSYGAALAAEEKYNHGLQEYRRLMKAMEATQLPDEDIWEPLV